MKELDASVALLAVLLSTACGVTGIGQASTSDLINDAGTELAHATGLEVSGAFSKDSEDFSVDIQMNPPHSAHITGSKNTSSQTSVNYEAVQIDSKDYYRSLDLARIAAGGTAEGSLVARMLGGRWFTYKGTPFDLGVFASAADIKANFLTDLKVSRKDNVDAGGQNTAQLASGDYVLNITEASPHRLVFLQTVAGKTVQGMSQAHMAIKNYEKDFAIQAPTKVIDLDDPTTWPPLYTVVSVENSRCGVPCTLSAALKNLGGVDGASAPSSVTFDVTNSASHKVLGSCTVTIHPDVPHNQTVTERCTISGAAWTNFSGRYSYGATPHNPAYD